MACRVGPEGNGSLIFRRGREPKILQSRREENRRRSDTDEAPEAGGERWPCLLVV
jgi:hypothetical protein